MKLLVTKATTSKTMLVFILDSSSTVGAGLTGLTFGSAGLTWYYYREGAGTGATSVTLATQTIGTWATGGFIELDATNMPGWYELGVPDAVLATGVDFVGMQLKGATNMAPLNIEIQLTDFDVNDGVRGALTALPNAAADTAGGLPISDAGGLDLDSMKTDTAAILVDTGTTLPATLGTPVADVSADIASMKVDTAAILVDTAEIGVAGAGLTDLGGMSTGMKAEVQVEANAACVDVITVDAISEIAQGVPSATPNLSDAVMLMYMTLRNKLDVDTTSTDHLEVYNDAGVVITKKVLTDDGTVYSEAKMITGP